MNTENKRKTIINIIYYALLIGIFYLVIKYAFSLLLPIFLALFVALILQKPVNAIVRKTPVKKGVASVVCVIVLIVVFGGIIALIGASLVSYLKSFAEYIRGFFSDTEQLIENIRVWALTTAEKFPASISKLLTSGITDIFAKLTSSPEGSQSASAAAETVQSGTSGLNLSAITSWLSTPLTSVVSTAMQIPTMLLNTLITIIMCCFLTADFDFFTSFLYAQLSEKNRKNFERAKFLLKTSFVKILRAYSIIILITFCEMLVGLTVLKLIGVYKSSYIVIIAAVTAVVDILPVLGTGTVIFPWAVYSLIVGNYGLAIGLVVIYAVISILRQVIEPKLVAGQLGLPPFITIIGMFLGLKIFGFIGMLIMPILIIMLKLLNDEGILRLWKSPVVKEAAAAQKQSDENTPPDSENGDTEKEN